MKVEPRPKVFGKQFVDEFERAFDDDELRALMHKHYDERPRQVTQYRRNARSSRAITRTVQEHGVLFNDEYDDIRALIDDALSNNDRASALGYLRVFEYRLGK